ncbi:MAG TPA: MFS transporter [Sphingobium sp.]|uniref:MFS transporter n=1 Tax=Sphingobium sp. TaxID=1912891 RepID=UPI002ED3B685
MIQREREGAAREWGAHWPTVLVSAIGMSYTAIYVYASGPLIQPLEQEYGWSRTMISSGIPVATTIAALLGPIMGWVIDRFGSRRIAIPGIILYWIGFATLSLTSPSIWSWWLLWGLVGFCGLGIKPALWTTAVASLFSRSRGLALAVTLSGTGLGSFFTPLLTTWLIEAYGWRMAFIGLSLVFGGIGFPLIFFFFHDALYKQQAEQVVPIPARHGMAMRESLLSCQFLSLTLAALLFSLLAISTVANLIPILSSEGIGRNEAAGIASAVGITSIIGRLATGWLLDRFDARLVTTVAMALPVAAAGLLLVWPGEAHAALIAALVMGLSLGAEVDAIAYLTGRYFGLKHYGLLFGTMISATAIATGFGPMLASMVYDNTGSYRLQLIIVIPLSLIAALLILTLGRPKIQAAAPTPN